MFVGATINFHYPISHSGNKVCLCCFSFCKKNTAIAQEMWGWDGQTKRGFMFSSNHRLHHLMP